MRNAVIVDYVRSPFTPAKKGELAEKRPDDIAGIVIAELVKRTGINPALIEDVKLGCAFPEGEQGLNMGRQVVFIAGLPISVGGTTVNRFCGSSMDTIHEAVGAIAAGAGDAFICAGVESMSRIPMGGLNPGPNPDLYDKLPAAYEGMGVTAENLANKYKISRKEQEEFALRSHQKAAAAQEAGKFNNEIVAIDGVTKDGGIRKDGKNGNA
jgi:acetyl-CoA acyltransferase